MLLGSRLIRNVDFKLVNIENLGMGRTRHNSKKEVGASAPTEICLAPYRLVGE